MVDNMTESQSQIPNRSVIDISLDHDVITNDDKVVDDTQGTIKSKEVHKVLIIILYYNYKGLDYGNSNTLSVSLCLSLSPLRIFKKKEMLLVKLVLQLSVGFKN